jgi:hypothetical protein
LAKSSSYGGWPLWLPKEQGVCGLAIYIKKLSLRQKKNYGNSNISPCKSIIFIKKNPLKETKILQDIIITL